MYRHERMMMRMRKEEGVEAVEGRKGEDVDEEEEGVGQ